MPTAGVVAGCCVLLRRLAGREYRVCGVADRYAGGPAVAPGLRAEDLKCLRPLAIGICHQSEEPVEASRGAFAVSAASSVEGRLKRLLRRR